MMASRVQADLQDLEKINISSLNPRSGMALPIRDAGVQIMTEQLVQNRSAAHRNKHIFLLEFQAFSWSTGIAALLANSILYVLSSLITRCFTGT
jgi:hypothetical protein